MKYKNIICIIKIVIIIILIIYFSNSDIFIITNLFYIIISIIVIVIFNINMVQSYIHKQPYHPAAQDRFPTEAKQG